MQINPDDASVREFYQWMINTIIPRPIAWVSTVDSTGRTNLAPFSFFAGVSARPPTLMFCPSNDRFGRPKDTLRNIEATREFVVNLVPFRLAGKMNATSEALPPEESEFTKFEVPSEPSLLVKPPRVSGSPVVYECRLDRVVHLAEGPAAGNAVFGRILMMHVDDSVLGANGLPDPAKLDLVARLGGEGYVRMGQQFVLPRPNTDRQTAPSA